MQGLFTIGYEGSDIDRFVDTLITNEIDQVADIRETPISRKPGFAKKRLSARLQDAGIRYTHWRELGAPKNLRDSLRRSRDYGAFFHDYRIHLNGQAAALTEVSQLAGRVVLLCFERDPCKCHRSVVAELLRRPLNKPVQNLIPRLTRERVA